MIDLNKENWRWFFKGNNGEHKNMTWLEKELVKKEKTLKRYLKKRRKGV